MSALQIKSAMSRWPFNFSPLLLFFFSSLFWKSHRYPEQHDKNNNALFTGQYIVTVQLSLAVDLWICFARMCPFDCGLILRGRRIWESALSWKQSITTVSINCSPIRISPADFYLIIMWLHYTLNSYHCTDCKICFFLFITVDLWIKTKNVYGFSLYLLYKLRWLGAHIMQFRCFTCSSVRYFSVWFHPTQS